jgi:hypothetical protein
MSATNETYGTTQPRRADTGKSLETLKALARFLARQAAAETLDTTQSRKSIH